MYPRGIPRLSPPRIRGVGVELSARIYVAGHNGLVGAAMLRALQARGHEQLITHRHATLDLTNQLAVDNFFSREHPDYVFLAAAKVGGIHANDTFPADFIRDNLLIQTHVIDAAYRFGVKKLLFLGSSCIYPRHAPQPIPEDALLTGPLEPTNEWYAIAKISGIKMCQAYRRQYGFSAIALMPTNLYGPGDNFHPTNSHVVPALIRRFHEAKEAGLPQVVVWGTGTPLREFLHVDDLAEAACFLMDNYDDERIINIGTGDELSIGALAAQVAEVVGYRGEIIFDATKPDGIPRKLVDTSRLSALGWQARIGLREGITDTYRWFLDHLEIFRK